MHVVVVAGKFERQRIGVAAYDRRLASAELARWLRQASLGGLARSNQRGAFGRKRDFKLARARHGAHAPGDGALERLLRGFALAGGLTV
jgi:hypothetical protein